MIPTSFVEKIIISALNPLETLPDFSCSKIYAFILDYEFYSVDLYLYSITGTILSNKLWNEKIFILLFGYSFSRFLRLFWNADINLWILVSMCQYLLKK